MKKYISLTLSNAMILYFFIFVKSASALTFTFNSPIVKTDASSVLEAFLQWVLTVAGLIALAGLILASMAYMTSAGDVSKAKNAKRAVLWTFLGLMLVLLSYALLLVIDSIFT